MIFDIIFMVILMNRFRRLSRENVEIFEKVYNEVKKNPRFRECRCYISHGKTDIRTHMINVAYLSLSLSEKLGIKVDKEALVRGALLHDFYLYDWHDKKLSEFHGFRHPSAAIKEALKDYDLTKKEQEMIKHHMFPFTYNMPKSNEAKLLCIADKICAWGEMVDGILII